MNLKEAIKHIEVLEERIAGQNALIDLMHEEAGEAKKRIADLEYRSAGQNRLIDIMREELGQYKREAQRAGRLGAGLVIVEKHYDNKKIKRNAVKSQKHKERDEHLKMEYTLRFNELVAEYLKVYPNHKVKAYSDARQAIVNTIYYDELLESGREVFAGYSLTDKIEFTIALKNAMNKKAKEQISVADHQKYSKEYISERKQNIKDHVTDDSFKNIGKATMIGTAKARKLFPTPK